MVNTIMIGASLALFVAFVIALYIKNKNTVVKASVERFNNLEKVVELIKTSMVELIREDYSLGLSNEEVMRLYKRKSRIESALMDCMFGIDSAKTIVMDLIRGFLAEKIKEEEVSELLGFTYDGIPSYHTKFEAILYRYKKKYGKQAVAKWIDMNNLDRERPAYDSTDEDDAAYYITEQDIDVSFENEVGSLDKEEQLDLLTIIVYQVYKGFGIIDTLAEMDINGLICGTNGPVLSAIDKMQFGFKSSKSVWLYNRGKYIHLRFMDFKTEEELARVAKLMARWGSPGPITAKRGYLVNTMSDRSRILVTRPPASEYWAIFMRKFNLSDVSPESLINKEFTVGGNLVIKLLEFMLRGEVTFGVTGRQGSGKTTLISSIVRFIDRRLNIRVLELAPELYLRELYPDRNILSVQETGWVTAAELQDAIKKADGAVSIVGEVATDAVAARMIQMGQLASKFTIFTHHANTAKDMVLALRNSLANAAGFSNMLTAEKQVTDVVRCDVHLDYTPDGHRYIERITEVIALEEGVGYPEYDPNDPVNSINSLTREYYSRSTDRVNFITRDILRYDLDTHTYKVANHFSPQLESKMRMAMSKRVRKRYDLFMLENWGAREEDNLSDSEVERIKAELRESLGSTEKFVEQINESAQDASLKEDTLQQINSLMF